MTKLEPLLGAQDIILLFCISLATLFRWLREARAGRSDFPLPVPSPGRRLLWKRDSIEAYLAKQHPPNVPKIETPSQLKKRHNAAMSQLETKHGVKVKPRTEGRTQ